MIQLLRSVHRDALTANDATTPLPGHGTRGGPLRGPRSSSLITSHSFATTARLGRTPPEATTYPACSQVNGQGPAGRRGNLAGSRLETIS